MVSEFWFVAFLTSYIPKSAFRPLWSYQVGKNFGKDLRTSNQCNPVTKLPQKPWRTSRNSQLLAEISRGHLNTDDDKKQWKITHFHPKKWALKQLLVSFWACMTLIFHARQFYINSKHIWHILRAKKFDWFFNPFSPFFLCHADFRKL